MELCQLIKSYFGEETVCNFIKSMIEKSKYCSNVMKKYFHRELEKDNEDFEKSTKCWIFDDSYIDGDVKVRAH